MTKKMHSIILNTGNILLSTDAPLNNPDSPRTFSGIANSGKPFVYRGVRAIIDLSTVTFKNTIPALDGHDNSKRVGIAELSVTEDGLTVTGSFLANEFAQAITSEADQGFPWELSVRVEAGELKSVPNGSSTEVNGQCYDGKLEIMHHCTIREVSFTPTGVDSQSKATVLSAESSEDDRDRDMPKDSSDDTENKALTLEEALEKIEDLQAQITSLKRENDMLKAEQKKANVDKQLASAGFEQDTFGDFKGISSETYQLLLSISPSQADAMITDIPPLAQQKPEIPHFLLTETTPARDDDMLLASGSTQRSLSKGLDVFDRILRDKGVLKRDI